MYMYVGVSLFVLEWICMLVIHKMCITQRKDLTFTDPWYHIYYFYIVMSNMIVYYVSNVSDGQEGLYQCKNSGKIKIMNSQIDFKHNLEW